MFSMIGTLFLGWARVGVVAFGGGPALIPLMRAECVETHGWMTDAEFLDALAMNMILPGPISAKMSVFVGWKIAGILGALAAFVGVMMPSALMMMTLALVYNRFRDSPVVDGAMKAVKPAVVALLAWTVLELVPDGVVNKAGAVIAVGTFALLLLRIHPALVLITAMGAGALFLR